MILPKIPSQLLSIALADLEKAEQDPDYEINMGYWHIASHYTHGRCAVCFAGAVMAGTLQANPTEDLTPHNFKGNRQQLMAVDCFRVGMIETGLGYLGFHKYPDSVPPFRNMTDYEKSPVMFKAQIRDMIETFEKAGL